MIKQDPLDGNVPGRAPARGAVVNIASQLGIVSKANMGIPGSLLFLQHPSAD
jgi:hypothetical protein